MSGTGHSETFDSYHTFLCRAMDELFDNGFRFMSSVLMGQHGGRGTILICGQSGSEGPGSGKTSLAKLLCSAVAKYPFLAHISIVDCTSFRGMYLV